MSKLKSLLIFSGLFLMASPVMAGRYVFNQTPRQIKESFGKPKQILQGNEMEYLYSPQKFQRLFSFNPKSEFRLQFTQGKVTKIILNFPNMIGISKTEYNWDKESASKAFQYFFGYLPPAWVELSSQFTGNETIYNYEYCLGDGVATRFTRMGYGQWTEQSEFYYDQRCESY